MPRRLFLGSVLCGLFTLAVSAANPQDKKDKAQEAKLQRELREARAELAQAKQQAADLRQKNAQLQAQLKKERNENDDKTLKALRQEVADLKQKNAQLEEQTKKAKAGGDDKAAQTAQSQLDALRKAGYVHCVVFRLKPDTPRSEVQALLDDVPALLGKIKSVRGIWAGPPAQEATPEVAVKDYEVGLLVLFDDAAGLKKYLDDPLHTKFVEKHAQLWQAPQVYDFQRK